MTTIRQYVEDYQEFDWYYRSGRTSLNLNKRSHYSSDVIVSIVSIPNLQVSGEISTEVFLP